MKHVKWVGSVASLAFALVAGNAQTPEAPALGAPEQPQAVAPVNLSPGAAEVVRLASSGVGDDVVLAYIRNSQAPFSLSADHVLYLKDVGLSPQVTSAMLSHDTTLRGGQPQQYAPAAPTTPSPVAPAAPAPAGNAPPTYNWQPPPAAPTAQTPAPQPPPEAAPPPAYVTTAPADVNYFYNDLSPYGTWVSLEGYGWCWQPRAVVISHAWRPYCDGGHWVYTDTGWFWQSDYSWGWAPFHYGRWYMHPRCGWVWTPDRVWGPAWVTWRAGGDVCGWAPLPPHADFDVRLGWRFNGVSVGASFDFGLGVGAFAFVSFGDFCNHDLGHRRLPPERVTTVYHQTTIINNYEVHNNTIVHRGIPIERVSAASRVPVPRATVRDLPAGSARVASRSTSVVYRPQLQAPARPVKMVAQQVDARHPVIQHPAIAPARTAQPATFSHSGSAPAAAPRRSPMDAPKTFSGSSGTKPSSSSQYQSTPKTYQPAPKAPPAPAPTRQPEERKQPTASTPSSASPHTAAESPPAAKATPSEARNTHVYYPKGYYQSPASRSASPSEQGRSSSAFSPANNPESRSKRN